MPVNLQEKTIPSSATLFSLALLTLWSTQPTRAQDNNNGNINCISLASSKACPAFEQYYVGFPGLANRYSYLANVTDLDSFDQSLLAQVHSTDDYLLPLGCSSKNNDNVPYARYSLSRLCAGLIQDADDSLPCNFQHNLTPPPLCKTTCDDRVSSIEMITSNEDVCSVDTTRRNNTIADLKNQCTSWQGYNGTDSQNCIAGQVNEPNNCGFQDDMEAACQFCSSSTDSCCQNISCKNGLSAGAIAGIVVGSVIGIALIALASFCLCSRRKRVRNDHFKFTTYVAPRDDYQRDSTRTSTIPLNNEPPLSTTSYTSHDHLNDIPTPPTPTAVVPGATATTAVGTTFESLSSSSSPISAAHLPSVVPPPPESSSRQVLNNVEGESSLQQPRPEDLYMVVHPYPPQMGDELGLHVGDIIYVALNFDDGWGLGINAMTGLKGAFPMVCVEPIPKDALDEMMLSIGEDDSSKVLIEDGSDTNINNNITTNGYNHYHREHENNFGLDDIDLNEDYHNGQQQVQNPFADTPPSILVNNMRCPQQDQPQTPSRLQLVNMDRLKESVRRSMSLGAFTLPRPQLTNHSNIPKRTASMRTATYGYSEAESPTSPTLNTPFFDVSPVSNNNNSNNSSNTFESSLSNNNNNNQHYDHNNNNNNTYYHQQQDTYELHEQHFNNKNNHNSHSSSNNISNSNHSDHFQWDLSKG